MTLMPDAELKLAAQRRTHISQVIRKIARDIPLEVAENLPQDTASEHDHYLYGRPKSTSERTLFYLVA